MGGQSVLVARWSVVRDLNPGRRSTDGRRRRRAGTPSRTAASCPPATGDENRARGVTGFFPPYKRNAQSIQIELQLYYAFSQAAHAKERSRNQRIARNASKLLA